MKPEIPSPKLHNWPPSIASQYSNLIPRCNYFLPNGKIKVGADLLH